MAICTLFCGEQILPLPFEPPVKLSELLLRAGVFHTQPCGGRGTCQKCKVEIEGAVSSPTRAERKAGHRLSCQAILLGDAKVTLPGATAARIETGGNFVRLGTPMAGKYGAAIDVGTTTVVLRLFDLQTGTPLATRSCLNPQTAIAADVMGRIGAAMTGKLHILQAQITNCLQTLLQEACAQANINEREAQSMVITGNTTMLYLLTGRDPSSLAHAPFAADHLFDETIELFGKTAYLPPCMSAFVGADITCAALASGLTWNAEPTLLCDIGTNGELALWKDCKLYVTSTAAGPAFEGAGISCGCGSVPGAIDRVWVEDGKMACTTIDNVPPVGVCGSGLIDAIAAGLLLEEIDETGALENDTLPLCGAVALNQADVRAVQLAKAAICAGVETLLETAQAAQADLCKLLVAGGFGSHLQAESAAQIGLLPPALCPKMQAVGNAALSGAAMALLDRHEQTSLRVIAKSATPVSLGGNPAFNERYMENMLFLQE